MPSWLSRLVIPTPPGGCARCAVRLRGPPCFHRTPHSLGTPRPPPLLFLLARGHSVASLQGNPNSSLNVVGGAGGGGARPCVLEALWVWAASLKGRIVWPGAQRCGGSRLHLQGSAAEKLGTFLGSLLCFRDLLSTGLC